MSDAIAAPEALVPQVFRLPVEPSRVEAPVSGSAVCEGLTLFHDAVSGQFHWTQTASRALRLTVYQFGGRYLSLVMRIPDPVTAGLDDRQAGILSLTARVNRPVPVFCRLNVAAGEEHARMDEMFVLDTGTREARFQLGAAAALAREGAAGWVDVIFSEPAMREIELQSLSLALGSSGHG